MTRAVQSFTEAHGLPCPSYNHRTRRLTQCQICLGDPHTSNWYSQSDRTLIHLTSGDVLSWSEEAYYKLTYFTAAYMASLRVQRLMEGLARGEPIDQPLPHEFGEPLSHVVDAGPYAQRDFRLIRLQNPDVTYEQMNACEQGLGF